MDLLCSVKSVGLYLFTHNNPEGVNYEWKASTFSNKVGKGCSQEEGSRAWGGWGCKNPQTGYPEHCCTQVRPPLHSCLGYQWLCLLLLPLPNFVPPWLLHTVFSASSDVLYSPFSALQQTSTFGEDVKGHCSPSLFLAKSSASSGDFSLVSQGSQTPLSYPNTLAQAALGFRNICIDSLLGFHHLYFKLFLSYHNVLLSLLSLTHFAFFLSLWLGTSCCFLFVLFVCFLHLRKTPCMLQPILLEIAGLEFQC